MQTFPKIVYNYLEVTWSSPAVSIAQSYWVHPDNCMDIVYRQGSYSLVGAGTRSFQVGLEPDTEVSGLRFRPGMLALLLGIDATEQLDQRRPLGQLISASARKKTLENYLSERSDKSKDSSDYILLQQLYHSQAQEVSALAKELYLSPRQLQRRLKHLLGYSPIVWLRIQRLRRVISALQLPQLLPLAEVAVRAGYSDQAHLSREVKALTSLSPSALRQDVRFVQDV